MDEDCTTFPKPGTLLNRMLLGLIRALLAAGGYLRSGAGPELELDADELPDVVDSASTLLLATAGPFESNWERKPSLWRTIEAGEVHKLEK